VPFCMFDMTWSVQCYGLFHFLKNKNILLDVLNISLAFFFLFFLKKRNIIKYLITLSSS
jgi:hypothetical protein